MAIPRKPWRGVIADLTATRFWMTLGFAAHYVAYHAQRGQGPRRIALDLGNRGVAPALIEVALAGGPDWQRWRARSESAVSGSRCPKPGPKRPNRDVFCSTGAFHRIMSGRPWAQILSRKIHLEYIAPYPRLGHS